MAAQPTGTVTLLFTDVEGSTRLLEGLGQERYAEALELHRRLLREAFECHGGYEVDCEGDSFFVAFARAEDAVGAAAESQRALAGAEWPEQGEFRVRIGLHTGEPLVVHPKYVGPDVHRAARIMAAAAGGQVLLSQTTRDLVEGRASVRDLGEHRLKDLSRPVRLFQLLIEGLAATFPPPKTLGRRASNLPVQPTPLVGRTDEVRAVKKLLLGEDVRLLTLTGVGGTGKTRVALEVAAEVVESFEDGVFFVGLAPIPEPAFMLPTIARTLGVRESAGQAIDETLRSFLEARQIALVLDNFEHLLEATSAVSALLAGSRRLKLLVTSREPLRLAGEHEFPVPPLALPPANGDQPDPVELVECESVALFVERASAIKPDFALTDRNAGAVAEICRRLDGLPLAIELAAARSRLFSPQALLIRLDSRLELLTGGPRGAPARQQTLRGAIDWSYRLLTGGEQALFARLSVFVGGCRLELAEAVCNAPGDGELEVLDGLASLVEKSLVRQRSDLDEEPRFWMLATIRAYAQEQLETREDARAIRDAFANELLDLAERAERELRGRNQRAWLDALAMDHDNLSRALEYLSGQSDDRELRLVAALGLFWWVRGEYMAEGAVWLESALARPSASAGLRARALDYASVIAFTRGRSAEARRYAREHLEVARSLGSAVDIGRAASNLACSLTWEEDWGGARTGFEESVRVLRTADDPWALAISLMNLGAMANVDRDYARGHALCTEALALSRSIGDRIWEGRAMANIAEARLAEGDYEAAAVEYRAAISVGADLRDLDLLISAFAGLAAATEESRPADAACLIGVVEAITATTGVPLQPLEAAGYESTVASLRSRLGDGPFDADWARGHSMTLDQAVEHALRS